MNAADAHVLIKVNKGSADPEELAAIVVALLAQAARADPAPRPGDLGTARRQRSVRRTGFCAPHSWRCRYGTPVLPGTTPLIDA